MNTPFPHRPEHAVRPFLASVAAYVVVTVYFGRDVLARLGTSVLNDSGDPILTALLMFWNAYHVPFTDAWWQFPGFFHTRDVLAFSEHLLGLSPLSTPIAWATGSPLVTYNIVMLLTFPLSGATMYALVFRLTRSAPAAFLSGLAFAFAPYRMASLAHIQMAAVFWVPLAFVGLHGYLDDGRRRWLVLYGVAWLLAALSNGYLLVTGSVLVGLWVWWFVVARAHWRALAMIAVVTVVAGLPLVPILYRYVVVHAFQGLAREAVEVQLFSADALAVFCAADGLTFWGWLQQNCRPEGAHFPGLALALTCVLGLMAFIVMPEARVQWSRRARQLAWVARALFALAVGYAVLVVAVLLTTGPRFTLGPIRASAGSVERYAWIASTAFVAAVVVSPTARAAVRRMGVVGFYLAAGVVTWSLSLGPTLIVGGRVTEWPGTYAWLMALPGMSGLRAPGRFWMMSVICLVVAAGLFLAHVLRARSRPVVAVALVVIGVGLLSDGWVGRFTAADPPFSAPDARAPVGKAVLEIPLGDARDVGSLYRALVGGWTPVNGYSGYMPMFYVYLAAAARLHDDGIYDVFRADQDLYVLVGPEDAELYTLTARQPGARLIAENGHAKQYYLPRHAPVERPVAVGAPLHIARLTASCGAELTGPAIDGDDATFWMCGPNVEGQTVTADLGSGRLVSSVVHGLDRQGWQAPRSLAVDTSIDGRTWFEAWRGNTVGQALLAMMEAPTTSDLVFTFPPHQARYVRLRNLTGGPVHWVITELSVLGGDVGPQGR